MSEIRAKQIASLFAEARMLEPKARSRFLDDACQGDRELRVAIEELLTEVAPEDGLLGAVWSDGAVQTETLDPDAERAPPQQLGHYRLIRPIGRGGMGEVWLAEQAEPIRRRVALKLIKMGMDTKQMLARFESERQALAIMNHPNIAKVHDAGQTPQGRPYFVMEYVRGEPITDYCDRLRLTIPQRLSLLVQACAGVQHAHHKAVIHRDIKPSNVLVSVVDGTPSVKIIDFGVAKAVGHSLTTKTLFTELGVLIGTPEYMSPEQAEMTATDVDTRTDVYSLGVVLYELLTGALPFDSKALREAGYDEIRRRIREEEPSKPSTRIATLGENSTDSARKRRNDPQTLSRAIRGDLDWITMRALDKDRARRYESPAALADDLGRHLRNEPVLAGPPSATYKVSRFIRRHRAAVVLASTAAIVVVGFVLAMAVQTQRIAGANADLEAVAQFQADMIADIDPEQMGRRLAEDLRNSVEAAIKADGQPEADVARHVEWYEATISRINLTNTAIDVVDRNILARAAATLDERFADKPLIDARLRGTIGTAYRELGRYERAEPQFASALATRKRVLGNDHPDTLTTSIDLAVVYHRQGRYDQAEPLLLETLESASGQTSEHALTSIANLAALYEAQGRYDEAEPLYLENLERKTQVYGDDDPRTLQTTINLASLYEKQGRYDEAEPLYRKTVKGFKNALGGEHPDTLASRTNLAVIYSRQARYDEAEAFGSETLETKKRVLGDEHPDTLLSMNNLAIVYKNQGRYSDAEPLMRKSYMLRKRVLGADHPETLDSMTTLAGLYSKQGRYDEAEALHIKGLAIRKRVLGDAHPRTLTSMGNTALLYKRQGRYDEAEPLFLRAIEGLKEALGKDHPNTLVTMVNLANLYQAAGHYNKAEPLYVDIVAGLERALGENHPNTLEAKNNMAWFLLTREPTNSREPTRALQLALEVAEKSEYKRPSWLDTLSLAYHLTGDTAKAIESQKKAIELLPGESPQRKSFEEALAKFEAALIDQKP